MQEIQAHGIPETDADRREIAETVWPSTESWSQEAINTKIRQKLRQADVKAAICDVFEMVDNFTPAEAFKLQIQHIRGGSYPALRDYMASALPSAPKRLQVDQRSVNVHVNADQMPVARDGPPPTRARIIGA